MSISAAQRTRLGIFIVISLVLTVLVFLAGIGVRLSEKSTRYYSEFHGETLSGLSKGMEVKFRGIPIGKVSDIQYDPDNLESVVVTLEVDESFPMKTDMFAQTGMLGITGLKYVEIMGGTNEAPLLEPNGYIDSKVSLMSSITNSVEDLIIKVDTILTNIAILSNPDSLKSINAILANVDNLTGNLDQLLSSSTPRIDSMSQSLNATLEQIEQVVSKFSEDELLSNVVMNIDSTILSVQELTDHFNRSFAQGREDVSATMFDLRQTMENLNNLSQLLLDNPSLILRGNPQQKRKIR